MVLKDSAKETQVEDNDNHAEQDCFCSSPTTDWSWEQKARSAREEHLLPTPYFLASSKFISLIQLSASLVAQLVKNPPAIQETWVQSLSREDPLEKGTATHSSMLAWRIPQTV